MKQGGKRLAKVLKKTGKKISPGISITELNAYAENLIKKYNGSPSFKNYSQIKGQESFPTSLCASINEEVVHAPCNVNTILKQGDIIGLDLGLKYKGMYTDMAKTFTVGRTTNQAKKLIQVTKEALYIGIKQILPGNFIHDIGKAIEEHVKKNNFNIVKDLVGHGVGRKVHEDPKIPNYYDPYFEKVKLTPGMTLAIEPMVTIGSSKVKTAKNGWTIVTCDKSLSAHFEHTVLVTKKGYKILTKNLI